jgi:site-specific DNA-methyltransferase (adenine-specific)
MEPNNIYQGDAAELLEKLDPESIDLTVTSPPYDKLREYNGYSFDFERIARGLYRATKPRGVAVWIVSDQTIKGSETGTSFRQALYFMEIGFNLETMIYQVAGTGAKGSNYYYWQAFEYMFVLTKGGNPKTSNRIADIKNKDAWKKRGFRPKSAALKSRVDRPGVIAPEYSVRPNVWRYAVGQDDSLGHPAPFPEALARDHIISWSNPGDLILDPMCGSGTTLKVAKGLGRKWIGFDVSADYCELSRRRVTLAEEENPDLSLASSKRPVQAKLF